MLQVDHYDNYTDNFNHSFKETGPVGRAKEHRKLNNPEVNYQTRPGTDYQSTNKTH